MKTLVSTLCAMAAAAATAHATLDPKLPRGEKVNEIAVAGRNSEICVIPKHLEGADYSKKDLKTEKALCDLQENSNAAVCPKLNSTNPGLLFYSLPDGMTPAQLEAKSCEADGAEVEAKYKLSTSCSYAPSLLAYYHISRLLGGAGQVPVAVLRTFDLRNHIALGHKAMATARDVIRQTWSGLLSQLQAGRKASHRDQLLTDDFSQSYGALQSKPKHEKFYKEFFNAGTNRALAFKQKNPIYALLSRPAPVTSLVGREFNPANLQKMVQLKDASEMIILDTLLNQQDRFGNIHYTTEYYYYDADQKREDGTPELQIERKMKDDEIQKTGAIQVKRMLLKDNDCGVAKTNLAREAGLAERIAHMDPKTYQRLMQFNANADRPEVREFFERELGFTENDFTSVRKNLADLAHLFEERCEHGQLKLDLDLDRYFSNLPLLPQKCE